jgi:hypothetical protein
MPDPDPVKDLDLIDWVAEEDEAISAADSDDSSVSGHQSLRSDARLINVTLEGRETLRR